MSKQIANVLWRVGAGCVLVAVSVLAWGGPADAHAVAVTSDPRPGARLMAAPRQVSLEFSEAVAPAVAVEVRVRGRAGPARAVAGLERSGETVVFALPYDSPGVYVVDWQVTSADDGHMTRGELAFAVGDDGVIPASETGQGRSVAAEWAGSALFVAGMVLALGGLATSIWVDRTWSARSGVTRGGLVVAMAGSVTILITSGGGLSSRSANAAAVSLAMACLGLLWLNLTGRPRPAFAFVLVAAMAWASRSHLASHGRWATVPDAVHLVAAGVWLGSLLILSIRFFSGDRTRLWEMFGAYSRLAAVSVLVLAASGVGASAIVLPTLGDLWRSTYGQLVLVKVALLGGAVVLAANARWRGLARRQRDPMRHSVPVELAVLAVAVVVATTLANTAPPAPAQSLTSIIGSPPITGPAFHDGGLAGNLVVSIAVGDGRLDLQVLAPGDPTPNATVKVEAQAPGAPSVALQLRPCGTGCSTRQFHPSKGATRLRITATAPNWRGGTTRHDLTWPPPPLAPRRLADVAATMRRIGSLQVIERVTSGPGATSPPGPMSITGPRFVESEPYANGTATEVRRLPGRRLRVWYQQENIWITLQLDAEGRIASEHIVTVGHQIDRTFRYES